MANLLTHRRYNQTVSLTTSINTTPAIDFNVFEAGLIVLPSGSTITDLDFYVCSEQSGTYIYIPGADLTSLVAERAYQLSDKLVGAQYIKIVANAAGSAELMFQGFR